MRAFPVFRFFTFSLPPPQFPSSPASDNIFLRSLSPCLQWLSPLMNSLWVTLAFAYFLARIFWDVGTRDQVDAIRYLVEWGFLGDCTNIWSRVCANRQLIEMWTQHASGGRSLKLRNYLWEAILRQIQNSNLGISFTSNWNRFDTEREKNKIKQRTSVGSRLTAPALRKWEDVLREH